MVAHGPSRVPSRTGVRLGDQVERLKRSQITARNAKVYQRRVAAKRACGGALPVARPRGPPMIGGVPVGVSRPPVSGVAPLGAGRLPVGGGAASDVKRFEV
jgi:hypothetical protein